MYDKIVAMMDKTHKRQNFFVAPLPPSLTQTLLFWYGGNARPLPWRLTNEPYKVWVSEIMLQQTRAEVVKGYYTRFLERLPTLEALARCGDETLLKLWEGLGYYARARRLKETANLLLERYEGRFPTSFEELLKLPGIGRYTAGAIASICFHEPVPAVDGNVLRVVARLSGFSESVDEPKAKAAVESALRVIYPPKKPGDFTQALMELGATVCLPGKAAKCGACPLEALCVAKRENMVAALPVRTPKRERKEEQRTVFLLRFEGRTAVLKREERGLLSGLYELPNVLGVLDAQQALDTAASWETLPRALLRTTERTHVFTHVVWHMTCHEIVCAQPSSRFLWASGKELESVYALPSAFKKFLPAD